MADRSAIDTIKGYFYQFDQSINQLLTLTNNSDTITVEGIEDIDISTATEETAIQCKYYANTEYNHSIIAKPIRLMLNHFAEYKKGNAPKITYHLKGHYKSGHHKLTLPIDVSFLKTHFLTYTRTVNKIPTKYEHHIDLALNDTVLNDFLNVLVINIHADDFEYQFQDIIKNLKMQYSCTDFTAEHFYYNNALRIIKELSIEKNAKLRAISKIDFLNKINTRRTLFNEWYKAFRSKKQYLVETNQNLKSTRALEASKSKIILIGNEILQTDNSELPIENFITNLISKFYKINSAFRDAKPITIVLECNESDLKYIKTFLIEKDIVFNDGYEHIKFSHSMFNSKPIITKSKNGTKIINSSYNIKIISKDTFEKHFLNIEEPNVFINFSQSDILNTFSTGQFCDFKYCETLKDIHQILTK